MKEIVALIVLLSFSIITTYFAVNKLISTGLATVMYAFAILSGVAISNYDFIKKIKWKDFEIETFERQIDKISEEALAKIHNEAEEQKIKLKNLNTKAEKTKIEIEKLNENTLKYAFFIIDPFTGTASTGGGHAKGMAWATTTDLGRLMGKAQAQLNNKQYGLVLETTHEIENVFPRFPGAVYIEFLTYKDTNQQGKALKKANELIAIISKYEFSNIRPDKIVDVFKYVIEWNLSNDKNNEALEIAKKALELWPGDAEIKSAIQ